MEPDKITNGGDGGGRDLSDEWWPWLILAACLIVLLYIPFALWLGLAVVVWAVIAALKALGK